MSTTPILTIQEFIAEAIDEDKVLRLNLSLSNSRFSQLKKSGTPSITTAALIYTVYGEVVFPYSENALIYTIEQEAENSDNQPNDYEELSYDANRQ